MRISDVRTVPVSVPTRHETSALGTPSTYEYAVVIVETDHGTQGLGEISTLWDGMGKVQCAFVDHLFAPALLGEDPTEIGHCLDLLDTFVENAAPARAAVEMALYDIVGKSLGVPVYQLLGGKRRDDVALSRSIMISSPARMAEEAAAAVTAGYTCVKVKVGLDAGRDVDNVAAVREAIGPDILLRVDANMAWRSAKEAAANIRRFESFSLHSVEQPVGRLPLRELASLREMSTVPVMLDESVWGPREALDIIAAGAADMLNVYIAESGGLRNSSQIFAMAQLAGIPCVIGSMPELGIGTASALHLAVTAPNLTDPCDACGATYQVADIVHERFTVTAGRLAPPDAPGLGVTLNTEALERYAK